MNWGASGIWTVPSPMSSLGAPAVRASDDARLESHGADRPAGLSSGMETQAEIVTRWRYLRQLLIEQLAKFESGELKIHSGAQNVSEDAIERLKREIDDFDGLIAVSERRDAKGS